MDNLIKEYDYKSLKFETLWNMHGAIKKRFSTVNLGGAP